MEIRRYHLSDPTSACFVGKYK